MVKRLLSENRYKWHPKNLRGHPFLRSHPFITYAKFSEKKHFLAPDTHDTQTYMCVSGGKKCYFFGKSYKRTKWMMTYMTFRREIEFIVDLFNNKYSANTKKPQENGTQLKKCLKIFDDINYYLSHCTGSCLIYYHTKER